MQGLFDLLSSSAYAAKSQIAASRAKLGGRPAKIAVVTTNALLLPVQGERYTAVGTAQYVTTKSALQEVGESAPVEEDQALPRSFIILPQQPC
jgi:hypothetical protein